MAVRSCIFTLYLHMGYFTTMDDALKWLQIVRGRYPNAIATPAPAQIRHQAFAPIDQEALTDTQVMRILDTRDVAQRDPMLRMIAAIRSRWSVRRTPRRGAS